MEFRILGPLEVSSEGRLVDIDSAKQRALLAVLLLEANSVVSTDRLIEALWEDDRPETAQKALQVHVSGLRKALGKERVVTREPGYRLLVEEGELDLARFGRLREEGRPAEALALWRGPALSDFGTSRFAQSEIARLEDARLGCLEERIEQDLRAGRHAELTGELEGLVKDHPLRERLRALSMLALYRSGRQAEALAAYQDARGVLVEELGIEPGKPLRDLHQAMLNQDPALDLPPEDAAVSPPQAGGASEPPAREAGVCERCGETNPPGARFCLACGSGLELDPTESRRLVTVLFCDVTGSTALGERRDPEQLRRVLSQYAREARAVVKRHGGMVEKFIGDAVMALFGLPAVHEDDALRAARAALELRANLAELNETLAREMGIEIRTRIGINSGEVVSGDPGGGDGFVTGDPVNVAKRLEEAAEPGEILIGEETYQLARDALQVEELAPLSLKGKQESIQAYRLVGVTPGALPRVRRSDTPMVGREDELALLQDAFARAVSGRACHLFTVRGSAGVGKSRLVEEALARLDGDALVLRGACLPYGEGITFWPVLEIVQQATGVTKEDPPERARAKIAAVLGHADESAPVLADRIAELIGMAEAGGSAEEGFWAVRKLLEALGQRQALVLVLDDLNWAEPMLLDLVEHVAEWARDAPILLVCLARPELIDLRPGWGGGKPNTTSIFLEPLSETESLRLIENLVGSVLPADVRARIQEAAAGNPLFVEEMVAMLVDEGRLLREDGHWVVRGDLSDLSVPPSIKVLIASRLDQLGADERRMLERAAVEGNVFHRGAVAALAVDVEPAAVDRHLQALVRKELVRLHRSAFPGEEGFCFRHPLIREATYESLPKETRSRLHQELAAWLEGAARDRRTEHDELLGYHLEQAFHYRTELRPGDDAARPLAAAAADRLGAAGQRALARGDAPAAASLLDRAASLVSADTAAHAHLVLDLGRALAESGTFDLAEGALERAIDAARASGDEALEARAQTWQLRVGVQRGMPVEQCLSEARNAAAVLERLGDSLGVAEALTFAGTLELWLGRGAKAVELLELAAVHAQRAGARREEVDALNWLVLGLLFGPTPAGDAIARCAEISERAADAPRLEAFASVGRGGLEAMQGRLDDARRMVAHGRAMLQDLGAAVEWAAAGQVAGWIELLAGDEGAAEGQLRPAYELLDQIGEAGFRSTIAAHLAEALFRQRRDEEALQLTRVGEEAAAPDDFESQAAWRMVRAKLCARQGAADEAEGFARSAVEIAQRTDYPALIGRAQLALAEVLDAAKRGAEAAAVRAEAVRQFELKGDLVMASAARRAGVGSPVA